MRKHHAFIGFGSNLGDRLDNCKKALEALAALPTTKVMRVSSFYETSPVGVVEQPRFVNGVALVQTAKDVYWLLRQMLAIEAAIGRVRTRKWGPRLIDLDLLLFDDLVVSAPELSVPHPLLHQRRFVLQPLAEIAPNVRHPLLGKTAAELLHVLKDGAQTAEVLVGS